MPAQQNAIELAHPFYEAVARDLSLPQIHAFDGIVTAALTNENSRIDYDNRRIIAPIDLYLSQFRDKAQTDRRDIDTLVWSPDSGDVAAVHELADGKIGDTLKKSTFGTHTLTELEQKAKDPWRALAETFVSDRYMGTNEWGHSKLFKAAFPFAVEVPYDAAREDWTVAVGDLEVPTSHPALLITNYLTRSIPGLRPKDAEKIHRLVVNLHGLEPRIIDDLKTGVGESQLQLGGMLRRMGSLAVRKQLVLGNIVKVPTFTMKQLYDNDAFMLGHSPEAATILALMHAKAIIYGRGEAAQPIVNAWQRLDFENRVPTLVHNTQKRSA